MLHLFDCIIWLWRFLLSQCNALSRTPASPWLVIIGLIGCCRDGWAHVVWDFPSGLYQVSRCVLIHHLLVHFIRVKVTLSWCFLFRLALLRGQQKVGVIVGSRWCVVCANKSPFSFIKEIGCLLKKDCIVAWYLSRWSGGLIGLTKLVINSSQFILFDLL